MSEEKVLLSFGRYRTRSSRSRSRSQSYVTTDGQSASLSWCQASSETQDQIFVTARRLRFSWCGAPSLTRGRVCRLKLLLVSPVQSFSSSSPAGLMTIFYCLRFETPLQPGGTGPSIYIPHEHGGPVIRPGTGFPFRRFLRLAGLRWRYSNPPPHWLLRTGCRFIVKPPADSVRVVAVEMCELIAFSDVMCQAR
jgi:hypothetical protein